MRRFSGEAWTRLQVACLGVLGLGLAMIVGDTRDVCWSGIIAVLIYIACERSFDLRRLTDYDMLTGALRRQCFLSRAERAVQVAAETSRHACLLMFDIDGLQAVNRGFGYDSGDLLLAAVGDEVREVLGLGQLFGRIESGKFAILCPETTMQGGVTLAQRLRVRIADACVASCGERLSITASFGVAMVTGTPGLRAMMSRVEQAIQVARHRGRDFVAPVYPATQLDRHIH